MVQLDLRYLSSSSCDFGNVDGRAALLDAKVREILMDMAKSHTFKLSTYKETLRFFLSHFGKYTIIDGEGKIKTVPCIYARPERAVAKAVDETKNLILPIISIHQSGSSHAKEKGRYMATIVHEKYWDTKAARAVRILSFAPKPVNLIYQVSLWSKYKEDLDQLSEQITFSFNPSLEVITKQSTLVKAYITEEADLSPTDNPDAQDRVLRKSFTVMVETYIESPKFLYTATGKIERINSEYELC